MERTKKRATRKAKPAEEQAGGMWGEGVRKRLLELRGKRSAKQFARDLALGHRAVTQWFSGDALPNAASLRAISDAEDVSTDWLLDYRVSRRRTDRESIGVLADELVKHLVPAYALRRKGNDLYPWAVAEVLHGEATKRSLLDIEATAVRKAANGAQPTPRVIVEFAPGTSDPRAVAVADPQLFFADVVGWIETRVERAVEDRRSRQEAAVRDELRVARNDLRLLATTEHLPADEQLPRALSLLDAAVEPHNERVRSRGLMTARQLYNEVVPHKMAKMRRRSVAARKPNAPPA